MSAAPLTVYYDASCRMCAEEMSALQRAAGVGGIRLVDCSARDFDDAAGAACGVRRSAMMRSLHARDATGRWLVALDAYEAVYRAAGRPRTARLWGSRRLRPLLAAIYRLVADHRQSLSRLGVHRWMGLLWRR